MKGIVVFDDRSDLAFYSLDKEMERYIKDRVRQLEGEAAPTSPSSEDSPMSPTHASPLRDVRDCLSMFFLPFFASFDVLNLLKKPVLSITGENGLFIVFRKFGDNVYIAFSKDEEDTEEILTKKLSVFSRIFTMLYGPVDYKMSLSDVDAKKLVWSKLASLLKTYEDLYLTDQVYLVEALEHVQFGQIQAAVNIVQKICKEALDNGGIPGVRHVMLLANTKLLSMCGRNPRIETSDILLVILLVYHHFHRTDDEEPEQDDVMAEDTSGSEARNETDDDIDREADLQEDQIFQTPMATTPIPIKERNGGENDPFSAADDPPLSSMSKETAVDMEEVRLKFESHGTQSSEGRDRRRHRQEKDSHSQSRGLSSRLRNALGSIGLGRRSGGAYKISDYDTMFGNAHLSIGSSSSGNLYPKFMEQVIFLQPVPGHYIPHLLYCLEVYPGIVLVMVAEYGITPQLAGNICQTISHMNEVLAGLRSTSSSSSSHGQQSTYDILDEGVKRVKDQAVRESNSGFNAETTDSIQKLIRRMVMAWNNLKQNGFKGYMDKTSHDKGRDESKISRLEACGSDLRDKLVKLFDVLYLTHKEKEFTLSMVMSRLSKYCQSLNQDYGEFLALKGMFNIPMTSFSITFPGMIHFIFIDRSFDELTSPSLSTDSQVGNPYVEKAATRVGEHAGVFLRRKIWSMVQRVQRFLSAGYTIQTWLDEDFLYSYYLWINVPSDTLGAAIRFHSPPSIRSTDHSLPGIIGSTFFADVHSSKKGYVYELYCLHEARVTTQDASNQCRNLAEQLWPLSREAIAPFVLIN